MTKTTRLLLSNPEIYFRKNLAVIIVRRQRTWSIPQPIPTNYNFWNNEQDQHFREINFYGYITDS